MGAIQSVPCGLDPRDTVALMTFAEFMLICTALAAALALRPWRMLGASAPAGGLATPLLASLTLIAWLWAWPAGAAMPIPLQWSGAPLAVLMLGWPLAIPVLAVAGASMVFTSGEAASEAISAMLWWGFVPATATLLLGHAARRGLGTHPAAYLLVRAFAVPLLALFACALAAPIDARGMAGTDGETRVLVAFLMAMGEATWTGAVASVLVACRPQWLATWSDRLYLRSPARSQRR